MEFAVTAAEEAFCEDIHQFLRVTIVVARSATGSARI